MAASWTRGKFQRHSMRHETSVLSCDAGGLPVPLWITSCAAPCASGQFPAPSHEGRQEKRGTCFLSSYKATERSKAQPTAQSRARVKAKAAAGHSSKSTTAQLLRQVHCQGLRCLPAAQKNFGAVGPCVAKASQRTNQGEGGGLPRDRQRAWN